MFGFHRDEVVGRRSVDVGLLTAEERTRLIRAQLASGGLKNAELVTRTKDGRPLHLLFSSKAMTLGGEAHHVTTLIDVTERKLVELERQKFFLLAESSSEFIGMCDLDMRPLYVNPAGVRMVGLPDMEAACSVKVMDYFFPEDQGFIVDEFFPRVLREGHGDVEIRLRHFQTGEPIWMYYYLFSLRDSSGTAIGWATVSHDITARKRSAAERDLLQSQLSQAQKMESVGRLAGGVAHDFNNMLSVILGYSDLALQKLALSDPLREDLEEIRGAARRSADLTRQLLAFSRKQIVAPKVLNINDTIEAMIRLLGRLIGENIALSWQPGEDVWPVYVDPAQVDQILANLCVNSRDAISGVGNIIIESRNASFDDVYCAGHAGFLVGDFVCIAVTDNGSGMDAETQTHLFEPYFTAKGLGKGTGLGLASVYGAVTQNSGFIQVLSEEGNGTTVEIYLPRHSGEAVPNGGRRPTTSEPSPSATILLVEDEPLILGVARRMLEQLGYAVLSARTPGAAMQLAETHEGRIDLLLTDVVMPEMNGRDLAEALQKSRPDLCQLFMSGYTTDVIVKQGVLDPGVNFIAKPFLQHELGAKVRDALQG